MKEIERIIERLELLKILIETEDEISRNDLSGFVKHEYKKENTYIVYSKRKLHKGKGLLSFRFQQPKKVVENSDRFRNTIKKKWNTYKEKNGVDIITIRKKLLEMGQIEI